MRLSDGFFLQELEGSLDLSGVVICVGSFVPCDIFSYLFWLWSFPLKVCCTGPCVLQVGDFISDFLVLALVERCWQVEAPSLTKEPGFEGPFDLLIKRFPFLYEKRGDGAFRYSVKRCRILQLDIVSVHEVWNPDPLKLGISLSNSCLERTCTTMFCN